MSELRYDGRVVLVTGAGRGIGRAEAELFARRGAAVVVVDPGSSTLGGATAEDPAGEVAEAILAAGGQAVASRESVATAEGAEAMVGLAVRTFGHLDAVVNNAGIVSIAPFEALSLEDLRKQHEVHVLGSFLVTRAAWPHLRASGEGRVVNTVSGAMWGVADHLHYGTAKGGVLALTRNLALAGAAHGVGVNAIAPGAGTRMSDLSAPSVAPGLGERMRATMPPDLVAPVPVFLAHPQCRLTGEVLVTSGGRVSRLVVMRTRGIEDPGLTPETVLTRLPEILDREDAHFDDPAARASLPERSEGAA